MAKADNPLDATTQILHEHGIAYTVSVTGGGHFKVKTEKLGLIFCSNTASDYRAVAKAVSFVRRLIRSKIDETCV